jgi:flagellar hook assembly protein FlgD
VADGRYTVSLATWDVAGNRAVRSFPVVVDTTAPSLAPHAIGPIFSPNGDGTADTTSLVWTASEPSTGTARLYHGTTLVRSWTMTNRSSWSTFWNGRTAGGTAVADGTYTFRLALKDAAGNARTATAGVVVDRSSGFLRWSRWFFPQDGDALRPTSALTWRLTRVATTTLRIYDTGGALVRQVWANRSEPAGARGWTWNGLRADGTAVPQGHYTARLTVTSSLGTQTLDRGVWATGFVVTPSASFVKPGQTLIVNVSTVEPLSTRPTVTFTQPGRAGLTVTATTLANGTYRASFTVAAGTAGSGSIRVSAKDTGGRVNTTVVAIAVRAS